MNPGGSASVLMFSEPQYNPCIGILMSTALKHAGLPPRDPYHLMSVGKPGLLDELFFAAGFTDVATTRVSAPFRPPSTRDYLTFIRTLASPIVQILGNVNQEAQDAAWAEMESGLGTFQSPGGWEGLNELLATRRTRLPS
ncbi:MAG: hypothetical protein Q8R06_08390 [Polaromonas sp.]|uniref:hypothetical protein n=1 Tax=Polaromonas sp. TaxID=1869339 RepID=UPI0027360489|nr:hypothetical protein [Polaromonas sp.]MDP3797155.1 hypothetical protein [Polaromonas sp.]